MVAGPIVEGITFALSDTVRVVVMPETVELSPAAMQRVADFVNEFEKKPLKSDTVRKAWTNDYAAKAMEGLRQK